MKTEIATSQAGQMDAVASTITYMVPMDEKPRRYLCTPPPGTAEISWRSEPRPVNIYNARALARRPSLDKEGFVLLSSHSEMRDFYGEHEMRAIYYPEIERLVKDLTGAAAVTIFDYNLRSASKSDRSRTGAFPPAGFAHADYTLWSAPQRVRDLFPEDAEDRLKRRFMFVNVWRPIGRPVEDDALAVCDAQSIEQSDLVASELIYADRKGEIYNITFSPGHRWCYFPRMTREEAMLFKCFDSTDRARANCVPHSAFHDPMAPPNAAPRESIEVRTVAFF
jgi:hypothetical protein